MELMALANGDRADGAAREALGEFYVRHEPWLRAMLRVRRAGQLADWDEGVKDVVQTTLWLAFESAPRFQLARLAGCDPGTATRRARAWLGGIANHVILDLLRAQVPLVEFDEERDVDLSTPLAESDEEEETPLKQALAAELDALPERERDIISADMEHKTGSANEHLPPGVAKALAEKWNTTPENIRQIRGRTRKRLKERLAHLFN